MDYLRRNTCGTCNGKQSYKKIYYMVDLKEFQSILTEHISRREIKSDCNYRRCDYPIFPKTFPLSSEKKFLARYARKAETATPMREVQSKLKKSKPRVFTFCPKNTITAVAMATTAPFAKSFAFNLNIPLFIIFFIIQ